METQLAIPVTSVADILHHHTMDEPDTQLGEFSPLPHWMQDPQRPCPDDPSPHMSRNGRVLKTVVYAQLFESALERIMGGTPLATIVANDPRGIQLGRFLFWIQRDPDRKQRYEEACEIAAEAMAHELTSIADALGGDSGTSQMEDVQRSALRIKARTYLMERWSARRYGDSKRIQIDSTSTSVELTAEDLSKMSISDLKRMALEKMQQAAGRGDVIDVEPEPTP